MSSFSLIPFYDYPFSSLPHPVFPLIDRVDRIARQVERLHRVGMVGGRTHRKDIFEVDLDVQGYKPQDLKICLQDNTLTISGSHEEKNEDRTHYESRHFTRTFALPENVEKGKMKACTSKDGLIESIHVEAPLKQAEGKQKITEIPLTINHK